MSAEPYAAAIWERTLFADATIDLEENLSADDEYTDRRRKECDMLLCVRDETPSGQSLYEMALDFLNERITVRELIRERVHHEAKEFNRRLDEPVFVGLVQPTGTEEILNGPRTEYRLKQRRPIDWEAQFARALDGFAKNAFFVIIDDQQAESLEQEFVIGPATSVTFVKLVPLVGG